ncbi:MAG: Diguanylate cyclase (GGDEF) domain-containing protein [Candidatus Tokpelaia sp. JSC189]|nr:MAG: Diguanylate cyclase (GGDEF) domain-containing protein [Candidatus Tokpelaia sp. JSC189]
MSNVPSIPFLADILFKSARITSYMQGFQIVKLSWLFCTFFIFAVFMHTTGHAANLIKISADDTALDLSRAVQIFLNQGKSFQISTVPGPDGIVRRIEVQANGEHPAGNWAVFSITNPTDEQIDRLIVAPHYRLARSGLLEPDLGSIRIQSITPSEGFALDRRYAASNSDVFRLTINPGAIITLVVELGSAKLPQLYLWEPEAYKDTINSYTLYRGILLGISALLALLLTILFIVKGTSLFPATAAFAWAVLAYICVDFNFLNKLFEIAPDHEPIWRASTEVALATSILIFLFIYLHLHRWHYHFSYGAFLWILALCGLGGLAVFDPTHAAGIARLSLGLTAITGIILIGYLSFCGYDRAIMLIPTWLLIILWLVGAYAAITGRLDNDIVQPALAGGLVLIVLLIGFTVMQHAFSGDGINQGLFSDLERQALAVMGTDNVVWDWDVLRDRVATSPDLTLYLGSGAKTLTGPMRNWLPAMHTEDKDRFRIALDLVLDARSGRLGETFRLRSGDGQYRWFSLHARPVIGADGEIIRCVGMMMDVTKLKRAEESLLQNSIQDNLTGLPNKQLFLDRLQNYCNIAVIDKNIRPTLLVIDFDNFRAINQRYGISVGDTFLLIIARRLSRHLKPLDTLCRLSADRFAFLLLSQNELSQVASFSIALKKTLSMPITFAKREIRLTPSIGLLPWKGEEIRAEERLNDAILAMYHAKYNGGDRIEPFQPVFRTLGIEKNSMEKALRQALTNRDLEVIYHPVFKISDASIVGLEAKLQWNHPARGILPVQDFIAAAENADLIMPIMSFALSRASVDIAFVSEHFTGQKCFMSIDIPSTQLIHQELLNGLQSILVRTPLEEGQLQIELSETVLIQNPELVLSLSQRLKKFGIGLVFDHFGTGYSSLDYFSRFPFDMVKLDHSVFNGEKPNQKVVLKSLIRMAHDLDLHVIADGVQNQDTALLLKDAHCDYLQSDTFCNPMNINDIINLMEKHQKPKR